LSFTQPAEPVGETICRSITYARAPISRQHPRPTLKGRFAGLELDRRLHQLTPQTILTGAGGVGFGGDRSQDFRFTFGFQRTLSTPADYPYLFRPTSLLSQP
jgi:hypothetical protein